MGRKFAIGSAVIVAMAAIATASALLLKVGDLAAKLRCPDKTECKKIVKDLAPVKAGKPETILILGSDRRRKAALADRGMPPRSDTIMLMRLDPAKGGIGLLSLPRDLKVDIPGHGADKINTAYTIGGTRLTLKVVKQLTGLKVNHVVNVDFRGFQDAVNAIGCVYVDIDRRYYHSNVGLAPAAQYAEINVPAGYHKLCGESALQFVRFRHTDDDLVRSARQQDFLRQARRQVTLSSLIEKQNRLLDIFASNTTSDIHKTPELLSLLRLVLASVQQPIRQIHWRGTLGPSYVTSTPSQIAKVANQFMGLQESRGSFALSRVGSAKRHKSKRKRGSRSLKIDPGAAGLEVATVAGKQEADLVAPQARRFPVVYPNLRARGSLYVDPPRVYNIKRGKRRYRSIKYVLRTSDGYYYGLMQSRWLDPPILKDPSEVRTIKRRKLELFYDGDRLRLVAWRTPRAVYWVSNTLTQSLGTKQMLGIAASLKLL